MMSINKQDLIKTLVIIWFVAATGYVGFDIWNDYKVKGVQAAYTQGYADAISQLIEQTEKGSCQPIEVNLQEKKVQVVDAKCLPASTRADDSSSTRGGEQASAQAAPIIDAAKAPAATK